VHICIAVSVCGTYRHHRKHCRHMWLALYDIMLYVDNWCCWLSYVCTFTSLHLLRKVSCVTSNKPLFADDFEVVLKMTCYVVQEHDHVLKRQYRNIQTVQEYSDSAGIFRQYRNIQTVQEYSDNKETWLCSTHLRAGNC